MQTTRFLLALGAVLCALPAAYAQPAVSGNAGLVSSYQWRGYQLADRPTFQAGVDVAAYGFTLSAWGSAAAADRATLGAADEFDLTLAYANEVGRLGWSAGLTYYTFPNQTRFAWADHATPEAFVTLAPEVAFEPAVGVYYDFHLGDGFYTNASLGHAVQLGPLPLHVQTLAGYNHGQFGAEPGFSHVDLAVSTEIPVGAFALAPSLTLVRSFENTGVAGTHVLVGLHASR